ncbi:MAG: TRAP transporter large permease [Reyranellaceae bacterium]
MSALALIAIIVLLLVLRQNLIVILFIVGGYVHLVYGAGQLEYMIQDMWTGADKEVLLSIPLFILAGNVMTRGSIAERLIAIVRSATAWLPGGMAAATILSCAVFAAISGSSTVTLLAVGAVMYPALLKGGYSKRYAMGAICAGGTLGIIIPPSIPMILYGISTEASITDLFIAGIGPGLLLTAMFTVHALIVNRHMPHAPVSRRGLYYLFTAPLVVLALQPHYWSFVVQATRPRAVAAGAPGGTPGGVSLIDDYRPPAAFADYFAAMPAGIRELGRALAFGGPAALLPVIILGGIYTGWFTATESAAIGLAYALLVEIFVHRELRLRDFYTVALETTKLLGSLFPILAIALSLNLLLTEQRVPQSLVEFMTGAVESKAAYLLIVNVLLLIVGCFMDVGSAILIVAPLIWPIAEAYGIDKTHFGIIMTVNLEIGFLTPPVGLNLIVAMSAFKEDFGFICRSVLPFIAMMLVALAAVSWIPEIALYLVR